VKLNFKISLHPRQWVVYQSNARFRVLVAGRRFGKTHLAIAEILRATELPNRVAWYVGPTDDQTERMVWDRLKEMTEPFWAKTPSEKYHRINLINGSVIRVNGGFKPQNLRGNGIDFLVLDEFAWQKPEAWNAVFRAALSDRLGRCLFIGTPQGRDHFYEHFEFAKTNPEWEAFQFTSAEGGIVPTSEINSAAGDLDPDNFAREYEGKFAAIFNNRAYFAFNAEVNVRPVSFDILRPLVWAIDFNVNPMCMLLMQKVEDMVHVLEEIIIKPNANTEMACRKFEERALIYEKGVPYFQRPFIIKIYGDASGNQRRTSGVSTDWTIIKDHFKMWVGAFQPEFYLANVNPLVRDRINCVNSRLLNQRGESHLLIDPSCKELIKDLEQVTWKLDSTEAPTSELDKSDRARTHSSDALGYFISQAFPLKGQIGEQSAGRLV
jgi:hypothetical protein